MPLYVHVRVCMCMHVYACVCVWCYVALTLIRATSENGDHPRLFRARTCDSHRTVTHNTQSHTHTTLRIDHSHTIHMHARTHARNTHNAYTRTHKHTLFSIANLTLDCLWLLGRNPHQKTFGLIGGWEGREDGRFVRLEARAHLNRVNAVRSQVGEMASGFSRYLVMVEVSTFVVW